MVEIDAEISYQEDERLGHAAEHVHEYRSAVGQDAGEAVAGEGQVASEAGHQTLPAAASSSPATESPATKSRRASA